MLQGRKEMKEDKNIKRKKEFKMQMCAYYFVS